MRPYNDLEVTDTHVIREFDQDIDPIELMWHRDQEDRIVESIGSTDWQIQMDNNLPVSLNNSIFISKYVWHRVIKGSNTLKLKIAKL
jgi:hypothetical protein